MVMKLNLLEADPSQDRCLYILGWCMIGALAAFIAVLNVFDLHLSQVIPPCVFHYLTGYYCPGCGGTRAIISLLHGHLLQSFYYHPFVAVTAVLGGWFMISHTIEIISAHRIRIGMHYRNIYLLIILVAIFGNWIVKNLVLLVTGVALI